MDTLFSRHRNAMVLVAVLFLQLVLLAFQVKRDKDVPLVRVWAVGLITPVEKVFSSAIRGVAGVWWGYLDLRGARQESQRLSEEIGRLKLSHLRLQEEALEARRLKQLLQFRSEIPSSSVAARVIGSSASETSRVLFLDRGSEEGIRPNMAVITPEGIVGKVHRVFRGTAQVLVITDPDSGVGALLENSRLHGVLRGHGGFFCQLRYIVNEEKVEVGERVLTSGEDLIYPKGLPIGLVSSVKPGLVFKEITVQPSAGLNRLEEVLVVVTNVDQELPGKAEPVPGVAEGSAPPPPTAALAAPQGAASGVPKPGARPPVVADSARARPETDADKLLEAYRAAQAQKPGAAKPAATGRPSGTPGALPSGAAVPAGLGEPGTTSLTSPSRSFASATEGAARPVLPTPGASGQKPPAKPLPQPAPEKKPGSAPETSSPPAPPPAPQP